MKKIVVDVNRRTTLKWVIAGLSAPSLVAACGRSKDPITSSSGLLGMPKPITGDPYGVDPDLLEATVTWERTMTERQLQLVATLVDLLIPQNAERKSGSAVGVPAFIDEWVSSPYEMTLSDRETCFELFNWLEMQARARGAERFAFGSASLHQEILDQIAYKDRVSEGLDNMANAFDTFRNLAVSAYFASENGSYWLGYRGNRPAIGDYEGPTPEAHEHLYSVLGSLDLAMPEGL